MKRIINSSLIYIIAIFAIVGCKSGSNVYVEPGINKALLDELIEKGNFERAKQIINSTIILDNLSAEDKYILNFELDKMNRIKNEFCLTEEEVLTYIRKYIPDVTEQQIEEWIESRALEYKKIDNERMFFKKAPHNLFLIDKDAHKAYIAVEGEESETTEQYLTQYLPKIINSPLIELRKTNKNSIQQNSYLEPVKMRVHIKMKVMPDALPAGEIVRIWLPYPHKSPKYKEVKLLNVYRSDNANQMNPNGDRSSDYLLSPEYYNRQSMYVEMLSNGEDTLKVGYDLELTSYNQYFAHLEEHIKPYNTEDELYKTYTAERGQHIIFTKEIKELTKEVVGDEKEPYEIVKKIWCYINDNFPWAGARDYSTIPNIPMYVLKNRHGDCGQVSLLFITMARYAGIPAKWQSGWMLHPNNVNLHDWAEVYYEGVGWVPVDQSFGYSEGEGEMKYFFMRGLDAYRYIVNEDYGDYAPLFPAKVYPHSDEVDFQMGEVEWRGGNILNGGWKCWMDVEYLN